MCPAQPARARRSRPWASCCTLSPKASTAPLLPHTWPFTHVPRATRPRAQVQTLGFLSHLKLKGIHGPFMVVGPLSTLSNWMNECKRFLPCLTPLLYHGSKQERAELRAKHLGKGGCGHLRACVRVLVCVRMCVRVCMYVRMCVHLCSAGVQACRHA